MHLLCFGTKHLKMYSDARTKINLFKTMVTDGESHPAPKEAIDTNLSSLVSADVSSSGTIQEISNKIGIDRTPHCCRHTCISLLSEAGIQDTTIKKIVGHSGAMTLTERVYTHLDVQILIDAVNKICIPPEQKEAIKKTPSSN